MTVRRWTRADIAAEYPDRWWAAVLQVPVLPLPRTCNSWIATSTDGNHFREVWTLDDAAILIFAGWTVRTAADHLARLNLPATNTGD